MFDARGSIVAVHGTALPEVTAGRVAHGRFLFEMTVELYEEYGFRRIRQIAKHRWIVNRDVTVTDPKKG